MHLSGLCGFSYWKIIRVLQDELESLQEPFEAVSYSNLEEGFFFNLFLEFGILELYVYMRSSASSLEFSFS